jgi:hypothetical protein
VDFGGTLTPIMSQSPPAVDTQAPPAASKPHATWGTYAVRAVAVLAAVGSFLLLVVRRPVSPIGVTALAVLFFVGFMGAVLAWDTHWKSWRSIVRAAAAAAVASGLVLALLQILPPGRSPETTPPSTASSPSSIATTRASATPTTTPSATATAEPTWTSSRPPTVRGEGTVKLTANSSVVIRRFHLRIAAGNLFDSFGEVRLVTDEQTCSGSPDVGESIVMTDRLENADDYRTWYRVVVDRIDSTGITLAWTVGSGRAPYGSEESCGVAY